jgi:adenylosuccinate synthase
VDDGVDVVVEGSQGFGLSLLHGPHYPFVTSRDTTASGFAMEVGLSPRLVDKIVLVVRTFPIRVAGSSGPLPYEISWETIAKESGAPAVVPEFTSVTHRLRRVGKFDVQLVKQACEYNRPTSIALMGADRLEYSNTNVDAVEALGTATRQFMRELET